MYVHRIQTHAHTNMCIGRQTDRHRDRQTERQIDRHTDRQTQTDRQTDTQTHRQTNRQTDRHGFIVVYILWYCYSIDASSSLK